VNNPEYLQIAADYFPFLRQQIALTACSHAVRAFLQQIAEGAMHKYL
jgi:hypothetical protein